GGARRQEGGAAQKPAEADVCAALGQINPTNEFARRVEDRNAVIPRAPAPAAPQVAIDIDAQAVGYASSLDGDEHSPVGKLRTIIDDVVNAESLRLAPSSMMDRFVSAGEEASPF